MKGISVLNCCSSSRSFAACGHGMGELVAPARSFHGQSRLPFAHYLYNQLIVCAGLLPIHAAFACVCSS